MSGLKSVFILVMVLLSYSVTGELYRVYVDREFGFWAVRAENVSNNSHFVNKTLSINTGDTIEFVNMDGNDDRINIISDNMLWEGGALLSGTGKKFGFTFNSSGRFRFHILENTHVSLNATNFSANRSDFTTTYTYIDEEGEEHNITLRWTDKRGIAEYLKAVTDTDRFPYQSLLVKVSGKTVGNGTFPVRPANATKYVITSGYNYTAGRQTVSVNASPTPKAKAPTLENITVTPSPLPESYQEFTLYEIFKRWFNILKGDTRT